LVETGGRRAALEVKLTPLGAYRLCGMPLRELTGEVIALEDVFGTSGRMLAEQISLTSSWNLRFDLLDAFLATRVADGMAAHPLVEEAWLRLRQTAGRVAIAALAAELGASRRHLSALFTEQVDFLARQLPEQGTVGDGVTFVQDMTPTPE
jgi:AraC-like DNA-binding protein